MSSENDLRSACRDGRRSGPGRSLPYKRILAGLLLLTGVVSQAQEEGAEGVEYALRKPLASKSLLLDGVAVDDGALMVAVGERGHVLLSDDQGESWRQATTVPTRANLTGVFFHDLKLGWAVGHDAVILRTRDGGDTWERLYYAPEEERPFLDVYFKDAENGFAVGAYAFFLRTTDGGDTWTPQEITSSTAEAEEEDPYAYDYGADYHLNHVARADSGRLYMAAEAGTIYRSDDEGETFSVLPSPYEGSFFGTLPLADDSLLVFGLRGHLFRSDDSGESWRALESGTVAILNDGLRLADGTIVVVGTAGALLLSRDGGETFELAAQADRLAVAAVLQADDGSLVLIGENGVRKIPVP